jgi:nucleoid DNA-binding protein
MTKLDIVRRIAKQTGQDAAHVHQVVQLLLDGMVEALARGERLEWREFGVLEVRTRKGRKGRNPRTGEQVMVPERKAVCFQVGKVMLEKIAGDRGKMGV